MSIAKSGNQDCLNHASPNLRIPRRPNDLQRLFIDHCRVLLSVCVRATEDSDTIKCIVKQGLSSYYAIRSYKAAYETVINEPYNLFIVGSSKIKSGLRTTLYQSAKTVFADMTEKKH